MNITEIFNKVSNAINLHNDPEDFKEFEKEHKDKYNGSGCYEFNVLNMFVAVSKRELTVSTEGSDEPYTWDLNYYNRWSWLAV